ncbi:response regulator [Candidatus Dependentiae bacterium]|nr:response regulator [Candidatus Dependentiae bacterium]
MDIDNIENYINSVKRKAIILTLIYIIMLSFFLAFCRTGISSVMFYISLINMMINIIGLFFIFILKKTKKIFLYIIYTNFIYNIIIYSILFKYQGGYEFIRTKVALMFQFCILQFYMCLVSTFFLGRKHTVILAVSVILAFMSAIIYENKKIFFDNMVLPLTLFICAITILLYFSKLFETILKRLLNLKDNLQNEVNLRTSQYLKEKETAEHANKAKNVFYANVSHDIRTPLNAIIGFSELINDDNLTHKQKNYLKIINRSCDDLLIFINDLLDISKLEAKKFELNPNNVNIKDFITGIESNYSEKIKSKKLEFIIEIGESMHSFLIFDEYRMRQIICNLINNSVKHTKKGYIKLVFRSENENIQNETVDLIIIIEDSGSGISPEKFNYVFEAFSQDEKNSSPNYGVGLGLAIVKSLTELMHGTVNLENREAGGTIFKIMIPCIKIGVHSKILNTIEDIKKIKFKNSLCLVVDDLEINRILLKKMLKNLDLRVNETGDSRMAIPLALKEKPDIILLDIRMPEIDGLELIKMIRSEKELSSIPVIAVSAYSFPEMIKKTAILGFDGFLKKPLTIQTLKDELIKHLPYKIDDSYIPEKNKQSTRISINEIPDNRLADLKQIFNENIYNDFSSLMMTFAIDRIEKFLKEIIILSKDKKNSDLENWAVESLQYTETFDIKNLNNSLKEFELLLKRCRNYTLK